MFDMWGSWAMGCVFGQSLKELFLEVWCQSGQVHIHFFPDAKLHLLEQKFKATQSLHHFGEQNKEMCEPSLALPPACVKPRVAQLLFLSFDAAACKPPYFLGM